MADEQIGGSTISAELASLLAWPTPAQPIGKAERLARIERAQELMTDSGADALLIAAGPSLAYFTGVGWGMIERLVALVLPRLGAPFIVCPAFEPGAARP
jgi:Xaa-Pro dipeptidase